MSLWITGTTRTGKTSALLGELDRWLSKKKPKNTTKNLLEISPEILVVTANSNNKRVLAERISHLINGDRAIVQKTIFGFLDDEVILFWPLLVEKLSLKPEFPLRLRPENEQDLAYRLWEPLLEKIESVDRYRLVRRLLDLMQLAATSGTPLEDVPARLECGLLALAEEIGAISTEEIGALLLEWRNWCWSKALLSYSIIYELYWRYLLPEARYQERLFSRYRAIFADDLDDYPAIAKDIFELMLDRGITGVFTYNPHGQVRLGLSADPNYLATLTKRCRVRRLKGSQEDNLGLQLSARVIKSLAQANSLQVLPESILTISNISRARSLRATVEFIALEIARGAIKPEEIAIIGPGLDGIARYTLRQLLNERGILVQPLNEQRPLISSPIIRALLTLLVLIYPGWGKEIDRDAIAEMLTVLSQKSSASNNPDLDPVRAGILADTCYAPDLEHPRLLGVEAFSRWDRLGHRAVRAYRETRDWIEKIKRINQIKAPQVIARAIEELLNNGLFFSGDRLLILQEFQETIRHYWDIEARLKTEFSSETDLVGAFVQLLKKGTIAANARPANYIGIERKSVTLATIFQYRSYRSSHRWHFWLDIGSHLWSKGGSAMLFGAPLFLKEWSGSLLMPEDLYRTEQELLERIIRDLLGRVKERVYLCHSDLDVNGSEQTGPLLTLANICREVSLPETES